MKDIIIFWFRRDLRVNDNKGLYNASLMGKKIIPLYIIEDELLEKDNMKLKRIQFIFSSLKNLDKNLKKLGSKLIFKKGNTIDVLDYLVSNYDIKEIHFNRNYTPNETSRDNDVWEHFTNRGLKLVSYKDQVLHERGEIMTNQNSPYKVFTPYYKKWSIMEKDIVYDKPLNLETPDIDAIDIDMLNQGTTKGGEDIGSKCLEELLDSSLFSYKENRDIPINNGTSKLSVHLTNGTLSIRTLYHKVNFFYHKEVLSGNSNGVVEFVRQLAWRDFYYQIIYHFPRVEKEAFVKKYKDIRWVNNEDDFISWRTGMTGFPFVDAGMRQLLDEGYMHNRLRMIVASFLTKDLLIDWRWGERHFKNKLVDWDLALNNGGWQWAASTGTDAQPYFRIFNPISQSKKFDPMGEYIRKYIPELKYISDKYIHEPHKMPLDIQKSAKCIIGIDYPKPIVDHSLQRKIALNIYKNLEASDKM